MSINICLLRQTLTPSGKLMGIQSKLAVFTTTLPQSSDNCRTPHHGTRTGDRQKSQTLTTLHDLSGKMFLWWTIEEVCLGFPAITVDRICFQLYNGISKGGRSMSFSAKENG
jgi:hypothetical protein